MNEMLCSFSECPWNCNVCTSTDTCDLCFEGHYIYSNIDTSVYSCRSMMSPKKYTLYVHKIPVLFLIHDALQVVLRTVSGAQMKLAVICAMKVTRHLIHGEHAKVNGIYNSETITQIST